MMLLQNHLFWKIANAYERLDDWVPYAEDLIKQWSSQNKGEVKFHSTWEIIIASYLLKDNILPVSAVDALAEVLLDTVNEVTDKKIKINSLFITPPKPGRKQNRPEHFIRLHEVREYISNGMSASEAYKIVGEKHFKSPDTIRRDYERKLLKKAK